METWSFVPCAMVWVAVIFSSVTILPVSLDIKLMVTVIVALVLHMLQRFMGPMRRFSGKFVIQYAAMAAYYLPSVLAFYTANSMLSSCYDLNLYYVMWCVCLLKFSSEDTTEMKKYTLSTPADQRWRLLKLIIHFAWLQWGLIWSAKRTFILVYYFWTTMEWLFAMLLLEPRVAILDDHSKAFADYMRHEYKTLFDTANKRADAAAKYPVLRAHDGQIITMSKIVQQRPDMAHYRDIFLSYSFCQLSARRYFGFHCAEEGDVKVLDFALSELLPSDQDYKRAFQIIEVQLAFLHDYFFTSFHSRMIMSSLLCIQPIRGLKESVLLPVFVLSPLHIVPWTLLLFVISGTFGASKFALHAVASFLLAVRALFVIKPGFPMYWRCIWACFQNGCHLPAIIGQNIQQSLGPGRVIEWFIKFCCLNPHWSYSSSMQPYWQEKMGQYSIIQDYDSRSPKKAIIAWFKERILSEVSHNTITHRPVEDDPVNLTETDSVKERVAHILRKRYGPPTNGNMSLQDNGVLETFKWTLNPESHTHTILIWHIATCCCDMFSKESSNTPDHHVALTLSRYCAYLVAFHPELLPDHSLHATTVLQEVLKEARDALPLHLPRRRTRIHHRALLPVSDSLVVEFAHGPLLEDDFVQDWRRRARLRRFLQDCRAWLQQLLHPAKCVLGLARTPLEDKEQKIEELLQSLTRNVDTLKTFQKGIKLGQELLGRDSSAPDDDNHKGSWKVMADFWAETILYIAPSDNAAAHIEQLAQGGQFVTHLWALLSNAGIFKRATEETSQPGPVPAASAG